MLYHAQVYFPDKLKAALPKGMLNLVYGQHAKQSCLNDRYGTITPPPAIDLSNGQVFEAEVTDGKLVKFAVRMSYDATRDISIVVACSRDYFVKTLWLNKKSDKHRTLDKNKYAKAS